MLPLALSFFISLTFAHEFKSIQRFNGVYQPDASGTLIVLDLDETVMKPKGLIGSEKWYDWLVKDIQHRKKITETEAHVIAMKIWGEKQNNLRMQLLDPLAAKWIQMRKKSGTPIIALTARRPEISEYTLRQLKKLSIQFSNDLFDKPIFDQTRTESTLWSRGVIFASENNSKGDVLTAFISQMKLKPQRIIFIDNYLHHLESVHAAIKKMGQQSEPYLFHASSQNCTSFLLNLFPVQP